MRLHYKDGPISFLCNFTKNLQKELLSEFFCLKVIINQKNLFLVAEYFQKNLLVTGLSKKFIKMNLSQLSSGNKTFSATFFDFKYYSGGLRNRC